MMQWKYAALAALVAGGAYVGIDVLRGGAGDRTARSGAGDPAPMAAAQVALTGGPAAETVAAPGAEAVPGEVELRLAAAEAERDGLRAALDAASAERDALAAAFAAREAEAGTEAPTTAGAPPDPAAEIERLLAGLADQAAEIDRLKAEIAARDVELETLRAAATTLPQAGGPEMIAPTLVAASAADAVAADPGFAARLDAAKSGPPAPRPAAVTAAAAAADAQPLALVLFERGSARLTAGAAERAGAAAATLAALDPALVRVTGHSDTTGSPAANLRLSRARAEAVAAALVAAGLPAERIEVSALGQAPDALPILTGDGVAEPLNRSVGIFALAAAE